MSQWCYMTFYTQCCQELKQFGHVAVKNNRVRINYQYIGIKCHHLFVTFAGIKQSIHWCGRVNHLVGQILMYLVYMLITQTFWNKLTVNSDHIVIINHEESMINVSPVAHGGTGIFYHSVCRQVPAHPF